MANAHVGDRAAQILQREYPEAVVAAGGLPRLIPPLASLSAEEVIGPLDGLVLTGGGDVNPARYGEARAAETGGVDDERDAVELALVPAALERQVPILGICRGAQLVNVALGGTLVQHLPAVSAQPHFQPATRAEVVHKVTVENGSELHHLLGRRELGVNSVHHQGVHQLAPALRPVAWADDGLVEAFESRDHPVLAVQWHPESILSKPGQLSLFERLVDRARQPRRERENENARRVPS
jgi:putative glutamine amidotransferase